MDAAARPIDRVATFPIAYGLFVVLATLDLLFTSIILLLGGRELNVLAARILDSAGLMGLVLLKYGSVVVVILICELLVVQSSDRGKTAARRLSEWAVAISAVPVSVGGMQLLLA